jgi:4-oxalocrotonate tautomerase
MPVVMVNMLKMDSVESKRQLVAEITAVVERICQVPRASVLVILREDPPENVGIGGILPLLGPPQQRPHTP